VPGVDDLEVLFATLVTYAYGRHAHDTIAIGVVDRGAGAFWCEGETHVAGRDCLILIGAGQAHTGYVASGGALRYRMLYPDRSLIESRLGRRLADPVFTRHAPHDPTLAAAMRGLHDDLTRPSARIERETKLLDVLQIALERYARSPDDSRARSEPRAVRDVRAYLEARAAENISLRDLATLVDLHPAYLNRVFREAVGLPPHAYVTNLRLTRAKTLLASGIAPSMAAQAVGFCDQSHLTRHFRRAFGLTPGRYQVQVRAFV
jgi:AraC-like DNA-binding protein